MPIIKTLFRHRYDVSQQRLEVCKPCPYYDLVGRCTKCGCFVEFKSLMMEAECTIGKWGPEKDEE